MDDEPTVARLCRIVLQCEGYEVTWAENGQRALEAIREASIDLVILDLQMPVMDGRSFFREFELLRNRPPVVLLSAFGAQIARQELGAEAALNKPFEIEALTEMVNSVLERTYTIPRNRKV